MSIKKNIVLEYAKTQHGFLVTVDEKVDFFKTKIEAEELIKDLKEEIEFVEIIDKTVVN